MYESVYNCMKRNEKKYTIRISKELHSILESLKFQHGTLENALNIIYSEWLENKKKINTGFIKAK